MTSTSDAPRVVNVGRRILLPLVTAGTVLWLSTAAEFALADSLLLSMLASGIVTLIEFLREFESRLENLNEATRLYAAAERSTIDTTVIAKLVDHAGNLAPELPLLLQDLADREVARLDSLLKEVAAGNDLTYDGEDREWLLGLTSLCRESIDAISLATVDAGITSLGGGLWRSDLGHRYVDLQRDAIRRGVSIRRIFFLDTGRIAVDDDSLRQVCDRQANVGVTVRILDETKAPAHLKNLIFDFIVFDDVLTYETTPATLLPSGSVRPAIVTTHVISRSARVKDRIDRFAQLWAAAQPPPWFSPERSGHLAPAQPPVTSPVGTVDPDPTNA